MIVFKKKTEAEVAATPAKVVVAPAADHDVAPVRAVPKRGKAKKGSDEETLL